MHVLAHAGGHTPGQNIVETLFLLGGMGLAWAAFLLRHVRLSGRPVLSWAVALIAIAVLELSFVLPAQLGVKIAKVRPTTSAKIIILSPAPGQVLRGNPATVRVRLRVTMQYQASTTIYASPGRHRLQAQFVAVDHGPFSPPVTASVTFRVIP
jgi:hypothetical protein